MIRWLVVVVLVGLAVASCGGEDLCAKVTCSPGRVCVPDTGVCQAADAGQ